MFENFLKKIYIASKKADLIMGQSEISYINLRATSAYIRYLTNDEELKTYGIISNNVFQIHIPVFIEIANGDGIYLSEPQLISGSFGEPDYKIESVKSAFIETPNLRNPVIVTARLNIDGKHTNNT